MVHTPPRRPGGSSLPPPAAGLPGVCLVAPVSASVLTRLLCVRLISQMILVIYLQILLILCVYPKSAFHLQTSSLIWDRYTVSSPHLTRQVASSSTPRVARPPGHGKTPCDRCLLGVHRHSSLVKRVPLFLFAKSFKLEQL